VKQFIYSPFFLSKRPLRSNREKNSVTPLTPFIMESEIKGSSIRDAFIQTSPSLSKLPQAYLQTSFFLKEKLSAASIPHTKSTYTRSLASLIAVSSAFVFVAQMLNFPIVYGTSGHLVGGTFHAMVLGHYAAILSMTIVLLM